MAKYNVYHNDNKVIVVSRFAGKAVRGIAKCDPSDVFNGVYGERLATARCDVKVCEKRQIRAAKLANEAIKNLMAAQERVDKMMQYVEDSTIELDEAYRNLSAIEAEAGVHKE